MPLLLEPTQEEFIAAGKMARVAELEFLLLERSSVAVAQSYVNRGRKPPQVELRFSHKAVVSPPTDQKFQVRMRFRLQGKEANSDNEALLAITATFAGEYTVPKEAEPSSADCQAFADLNGIMTCWPFWREFVQSSVSRMGLPPLTLPFLKVRHKPEEKKLDNQQIAKESEAAHK